MLIRFLAARATVGVEVVSTTHYARTVTLGGRHGHVVVAPGADGGSLEVVVHGLDPAARLEVRARLQRLFDLDADPHAIAAWLAQDPALAPLVRARPGLRVPGAWDGFELAVRAVLGQQVSVRAATQLAGRLVSAFGEAHTDTSAPPGLTHRFPEPSRLRDADVSSIGMPGARGRTIAALAAAVMDDPAVLAPGAVSVETTRRLRAIPGIGEWTAQYIAMRAGRDADAFPAADVALQRALAHEGRRPNARALAARAEAWRPWRAYAALHLWNADAAVRT
jgi:3-methyladenine DNA glycosylase/8-oxoguanine DNA glycosylase